MKRSGPVALALLMLLPIAGGAADATDPVDYTQRNAPFAPGASVRPATQSPARNRTLQRPAVDKAVVDKALAAIGDHRAAIDVQEAREKVVQTPPSRRPETRDEPMSGFNHQPAAIATASDTAQPTLVSKYQDSLAAASASNMARFPALGGATTAKINRFVFRRNPTEPTAAAAAVVRAGGTADAGAASPAK